MKKLIKLSILALLLLSITFQSSFSEPGKIGFGLTGGYLNASNDVHYVYSCDFKKFMDNFNQGGYFAGIVLEYPLGLGLGSSIITRLHYNSFSYDYLVYAFTYSDLIDDHKGGYETIEVRTGAGWEGTISLISLDIMPKIKIPYFNLGLFVGVSFNYLISNSYAESYKVITPDNYFFPEIICDPRPCPWQKYRYSDNRRTAYVEEGEIPCKNNFRYAIKAGLNYDLNLGKFCISPFITMDFPLNDVVNGTNTACPSDTNNIRTNLHWKITYYQFGIDLKYLF